MQDRMVLSAALLVGFSLVGYASVAVAQDSSRPWTTVGSAGAVDEADGDIVSLAGPAASVTAIGTLDIRYDVVPVGGLFTPSEGIQMGARYTDDGGSARVTLFLHQLNVDTGVISTMLFFDSNSFPQSPSSQVQFVSVCNWGGFDFLSNAYWVGAHIQETSAGGTANLSAIQIGGMDCSS